MASAQRSAALTTASYPLSSKPCPLTTLSCDLRAYLKKHSRPPANDPPSTRISHSGPQPLASYRSNCSPSFNLGPCNLVSYPQPCSPNSRISLDSPHNASVMTRRCPGSYFSGPPHSPCSKGPSIWHDSFHHLRSLLFPGLLLSFLPLQSSTYPGTRRMLTPHGDHPLRPL